MLSIISRTVGVAVACLSLHFTGCSSPPKSSNLQVTVEQAESTLAGVQNDPEMKSFGDSIKQAKAVFIIIPGSARGVALAHDESTQAWNGPAFYHVTRVETGGRGSAPFGFTAGKQDLDLVALAMTGKAVNWLLSPALPGKGQLKIGPGAGEPSERGAADMLVFDRSKGSGGTGNLQGTVFSIDHTANQAYYGKAVTPADILVRHSVSNPDASSLQNAVAGAAR